MKRGYCLFLCCLLSQLLMAQQLDKKHLGIDARVFSGNILQVDKEVKCILQEGAGRIYNIGLSYVTLPSDSSAFASDYNYPVFGIGISGTDFVQVKLIENSYIANIYSLYGYMDRTLIRVNRFKFSYNFEAGLAFAPEPCHPVTNPYNEFVSCPIMLYIGFGFDLKYRPLKQLELGLGIGARHYSNGKMGMPNKGINMLGADFSARYYFSDLPKSYPKMGYVPFKKHFYYHVGVGAGFQTSIQEWNIYYINQSDPAQKKTDFKRYPKASLSADAMYRFSRRYGTGLGVDLFYTPHTNKLREWDEIIHNKDMRNTTYNPLSLGVSINQEVYYKNLALFIALGYYAYKEVGIEENISRFYQRGGFRIYFPRLGNTYLGCAIKAHKFSLAEYLEFSLGVRIN